MGNDYLTSTGCSSGVTTKLWTEVTVVQHCMTTCHQTVLNWLIFMIRGFHLNEKKKTKLNMPAYLVSLRKATGYKRRDLYETNTNKWPESRIKTRMPVAQKEAHTKSVKNKQKCIKGLFTEQEIYGEMLNSLCHQRSIH